MIWFQIGAVVLAFLGGAAAAFFVLRANPRFLKLEALIMEMMEGKKVRLIEEIEEMDVPKKYKDAVIAWLEENF